MFQPFQKFVFAIEILYRTQGALTQLIFVLSMKMKAALSKQNIAAAMKQCNDSCNNKSVQHLLFNLNGWRIIRKYDRT